jgi:hypothetical protein
MPQLPPALFTDMQRQCQEVNGRDRPCAAHNRRFLAKPGVRRDPGDQRIVRSGDNLLFPAWVPPASLVIFFDSPLSHDRHPARGS